MGLCATAGYGECDTAVTQPRRCLQIAEALDALRVFPRLLLVSAFGFLCWYSVFALHTVIELVDRMAAIPSSGDTLAALAQNVAAGIVGATVPMIGTMFAKICDVYMQTGRKWER